MPFTPYHFGPSGLVGLIFRKYIDLPVFVLANVAVDVEVLIFDKFPVHRYAHSLLIGAAVGILWGLIAYPLRGVFKKILNWFKLGYETSLFKMIIAGILGVWFHVLIDAVYHYDVRVFWPSSVRPLYNLLSKAAVKQVCLAAMVLVVIVYLIILFVPVKTKTKSEGTKK